MEPPTGACTKCLMEYQGANPGEFVLIWPAGWDEGVLTACGDEQGAAVEAAKQEVTQALKRLNALTKAAAEMIEWTRMKDVKPLLVEFPLDEDQEADEIVIDGGGS